MRSAAGRSENGRIFIREKDEGEEEGRPRDSTHGQSTKSSRSRETAPTSIWVDNDTTAVKEVRITHLVNADFTRRSLTRRRSDRRRRRRRLIPSSAVCDSIRV